jgi:DNA-binding HxlR family transcriptional regulator
MLSSVVVAADHLVTQTLRRMETDGLVERDVVDPEPARAAHGAPVL